jgi:hypothetical protein
MTNYDEMTTDELQAAYELRFGQRYPDESLLLRRVLKLDAALKEAEGHTLGFPASVPPKKPGVYLADNGLGPLICEYDDEWIYEADDDIQIAHWWYLPLVPQENQP